jgi:hypothetical protein
MVVETGGLTFGNLVKASQYNFCGLGSTGPGYPGAHFSTPEDGVIAHCAHLAAYVYPNHIVDECSKRFDPRHPDTHWNWANCIDDLSGKWAVANDYGAQIVSSWNN